jgi:hypothetical protein
MDIFRLCKYQVTLTASDIPGIEHCKNNLVQAKKTLHNNANDSLSWIAKKVPCLH